MLKVSETSSQGAVGSELKGGMGENTPFAKQSRSKERDNDNGHYKIPTPSQWSI